MSNPLIPQVRVNKNGVPVTKHVRADAVGSGSKRNLPSPAAVQKTPAAKRSNGSLAKQKQWDVLRGQFIANHELRRAVMPHTRQHMYYKFACSDAEAFDVMSVVAPRDTTHLLASGVRTQEEAIKLLESHGLHHLIAGNKALVEGAIEHGVSPQGIIHMQMDFRDITFHHPNYFAAAKAHSYKALREAEPSHGVTKRVLDGQIDIEDIKILGAVRAASGGNRESEVMEELARIKSGESTMEAETLSKVIAKANPRNIKTDAYSINEAVRLARKHGAESLLGVRYIHSFISKVKTFSRVEDDPMEVGRMAAWSDRYEASKGKYMLPKTTAEFYKAGLTPEEAAERYEEDMTLNQFIAIRDEGIPSSMSGGWL